jgi:hypothetical protein
MIWSHLSFVQTWCLHAISVRSLSPVKNRSTFSKPFHNNTKYPATTKIITVLNNSSIYTFTLIGALLATCFLLGLHINPEDEGSMFLRNINGLLLGYKALYPRRDALSVKFTQNYWVSGLCPSSGIL